MCHKGLNSTYVKKGPNGSFHKIGVDCDGCNIHYDLEQKLYTGFTKQEVIKSKFDFKLQKNDAPAGI